MRGPQTNWCSSPVYLAEENFPSDASGCFMVGGSPNSTSSIAVYTLVVRFPVIAILRNVSAQHSSLFFYSNLFDRPASRSASLPVPCRQECARAGMPIVTTGLPNSRNFGYPGSLYLRGVQIFMTPGPGVRARVRVRTYVRIMKVARRLINRTSG